MMGQWKTKYNNYYSPTTGKTLSSSSITTTVNNNNNNNQYQHLKRNVGGNGSTTRNPELIKYKFFVVILIILISFLIISYKVLSSPQFNSYGILKSYINDNNSNTVLKTTSFENRTKVILLWTDFFGEDNWNIKEMQNSPTGNLVNETFFEANKCPVRNCHITSNRNYLSSIQLYDALLFHTAEPFGLHETIPNVRNPNQFYVYSLLESPAHTKHDISDELNLYNLTMTYRLDSDILWTYGNIEDIQTGRIVSPAFNPQWRIPVYDHLINDTMYKNLVEKKKKFATWFASHCGTISKRDDLVRKLKKYIQIDVYGSCGDLICPRNSPECDQRLDTDYKFYFSFENSLCKDYVTEKFFRAMSHNIIPIVYGGADYTRFAPPHSYINIEDFQSVKDLANYLKYLDENPHEYVKYFWWKKYYKLTTKSQFCQLCEILNDSERQEKIQFYRSIKDWWFKNSCRLSPNITLE